MVASAAHHEPTPSVLPGRKTLLLASTGGHLDELLALRPGLGDQVGEVEWATFDSSQSRSLLEGECVHFVPPVKPKDARAAWANVSVAKRLLRERGIEQVVTTGAAVAVPFLGVARRMGLGAHYIESAARTEGPSLTGKLSLAIPGVQRYTQHGWGNEKWTRGGSVFDGYEASFGLAPVKPSWKVVVTFGTQEGFDFRRAAASIKQTLDSFDVPSTEVLWQVGDSDVSGLGIHAQRSVPFADLDAAIAEADVVIAHAGVGSALTALRHGKTPLLLPRRHARGEHTDDHQVQVLRELTTRGLAIGCEAGDLSAELIARAAQGRATSQRTDAFGLTLRGVA